MSHGEGRGGIILKSGYIIQSQSVIFGFWFLVVVVVVVVGFLLVIHIIPCFTVGLDLPILYLAVG